MKFSILSFFTIVMLLASIQHTHAQDYKLAAGLRLGYPTSASVKYFLNDKHAVEAYVGTRGFSGYRWTNLSAAYQVHNELNIDGLEGLQWYLGGGATLYFWNYDFFGSDGLATSSLGLQGYAGLEYVFDDVPITVSVDWIPTVFVGDAFLSGFAGGYGTLAVRYIISD